MSVKAGLSAIADEVLGDIQKEAESLVLAAKNDAKEALKIAKQQADKNFQVVMNHATARAEAEKQRIASVAEVETRNNLLRAKDELVDAAFEKALVRLREFAASEKYHRYMLKIIKEVAEQLGRDSIMIQLNANDKAWLSKEELARLSKKLGCELRVLDETGDFIGGFKTQTVDGKITYDATIDSKFYELKPILRVEVAKIMFKEEG